ncbi:hypothetical protein TWF225_010245 [Orbilia oligospora]|nr:hypothetical protein TWF225_010245 [Orbilia oligospora]KAF3249704.1 hypothetical protein TWF128_007716 [Orbilia oligospora]KAF3261520.1 hypothetical protein TWF217_004647 [Orbilia oligospora]KAF3298547.1 hypothetical protein TWF132_000352 [Orbilia oligospora]
MVDRDLNLWWYRRQLGVKKKTKTSIPRTETFETIGQLSIASWKATAMARDGDWGRKTFLSPFPCITVVISSLHSAGIAISYVKQCTVIGEGIEGSFGKFEGA